MPEELEIVGYTFAGTPVFAIFGGDGEEDDDNEGGEEGSEDDGSDGGESDDDDDEKLGNSGKRALESERQKAKKARTDLKPWAALGREFGTPDQIREKLASKSTEDIEAVRAEGNTRIETMRKNIAALAVRALASEFEDPDDAHRFVDLSSIEVDDNGAVDEDDIRDELAAVLEKKPHLRKSDGTTDTKKKKLPNPDRSQGNGNSKSSAGSLTSGAERYNKLFPKKKN